MPLWPVLCRVVLHSIIQHTEQRAELLNTVLLLLSPLPLLLLLLHSHSTPEGEKLPFVSASRALCFGRLVLALDAERGDG